MKSIFSWLFKTGLKGKEEEMAEKEKDGQKGGADVLEKITEIRLRPGCEMTLEEEKRFLAKIFAEAIGHDGWLSPHAGGGAKGGRGNG